MTSRIVLLLLVMPAPALAQDGGMTVEALAARVAPLLPAGAPTIVRSDFVGVAMKAQLSEADQPHPTPRTVDITLGLRVGPKVTPDQRRALETRNDSLRKKLDTMERSMRGFECDEQESAWAQGGCFHPKTKAQVQQVDAYKRIEKKLVAVPTHHLGDFTSATVETAIDGLPARWYHQLSCDGCDGLRARLLALLTAY
ncbi:MAG: hypothetical protein Q8S33_37375 [Myxococcales bacterium]|nr:hypothetical protein [Myxococcales bacterium]